MSRPATRSPSRTSVGGGFRRETLAKVVTEVSGPAIVVMAGLVIVASRNASHGAGAAWGAVAVVLCAGVPMAYVARGVKTGKWSDHHVPDRRQRHTPLLVGLVCIATAGVLLSVVRAPRELIALVLSQLVGLIVVMIVTRFWKISVHSSASGGLVGILVAIYGLWAVLGVLPLALVAWSRTVLDAHTWPQVLVGAAAGATVALTVFPLLR